MDCKQATILIRAALDAGRASEPPPAVHSHIAACEPCRRLWSEEAAVEAALRTLPGAAEPAFPAGLHDRIMCECRPLLPGVAMSVSASRRVSRPKRFFRLGLGAAAALMLALAAGWPLLDRAPRTQSSAESLIPFSFDTVIEALDPAPLFEAPRQDLEMLASSILSVGGLFQTQPEPPSTPSPTPG